jgi:pentatricopeptide repeat protein
MLTLIDAFSASNAVELVRIVWMEIALAGFAAIVYFTLTGWVAPSKKKTDPEGKLCEGGEGSRHKAARSPRGLAADSELSSCQLINKSLKQGKIHDAIELFKSSPTLLAGSVPTNVAPRLLMAAAQAPDFAGLMLDMRIFANKIEARSLEAVLTEALKNKDVEACHRLHLMSGLLSIPVSQHAFEVLAQAYSADVDGLRALVEESPTPLSRQFAKVVLEACTALKEVDLAAEVFEKIAETDAAALRKVVEKAATGSPGSLPYDAHHKEGAMHVKEIRACGKNGDLQAALKIFEQQRSHCTSSLLYNGILDTCVACGDLEKALEIFDQTKHAGLADVVSYNTIIKGHVIKGDGSAARALLAEVSTSGLRPTHATYHTILNFLASTGDRAAVWKMLEEMQSVGVLPNNVTCSILLKGKLNSTSDVDRVLSLMSQINEPMDEVMFSALAEACIRTKKMDELEKQMSKFLGQGTSFIPSAPTYGSMIKAFGQVHDVKRVKELWSDMVKQNVQPTAITLGCMVEALVINRCTADAWALAQELLGDETTKPLVNTVIYTTILKGFANNKETGKVMDLYNEMKFRNMQPNTITYNTILNAFAQGGAMDRVPALLEDMKAVVPPVEPDIVTYSTIIKGFCNSGSLDRALCILQDMQADGKFCPDEVMYNSLLDGCAKEHRPDDALKLLGDMKKNGVAPSNYTMSMLVKLMGRCRRLKQAFALIEDISTEYGVKVNIQVYTCLIQACFNNRQPAKAVALHDQVIREGLVPDEMTYSVLVKGCLQASLVDKAVQLVKCSCGVASPAAPGKPPGVNARCLGDVVAALGGPNSAPAKSFLAEIGDGKTMSKRSGANSPPWRHQRA